MATDLTDAIGVAQYTAYYTSVSAAPTIESSIIDLFHLGE